MLVDTGIVAAGAPSRSWPPVPGRLPAELDAAGIAAAEVHTVVLTHMHTDHIGWSIDESGDVAFPDARQHDLLPLASLDTSGRCRLEQMPLDPAGRVRDEAFGKLDSQLGRASLQTAGHCGGADRSQLPATDAVDLRA